MIAGTHTVIRQADADDAVSLHPLFTPGRLQSALLDQRREPLHPNRMELGEILGKADPSGQFHTVEDAAGRVLGLCALRGLGREQGFAEATLMVLAEETLAGPAGDEIAAFLLGRAFTFYRLDKVVAHCLDSESALRAFWTRHGFESGGTQREVLWSGGRWHNLEVFTRTAP